MKKIKYFMRGNYLLAYNVATLQLLKFRSDIKRILPVLLPEDYTEKQKEDFLKKLKEVRDKGFSLYLEQLLKTNDCQLAKIDDAKETMTLSFAPVHQCNLNCKYCFAHAGDNYKKSEKTISHLTMKKIFDFVLRKYAPECKNLQINLVSGGEPFLNLNVCEEIEHILMAYPINKRLFIATNGTLYDENIKRQLRLMTPQLGISLDGNKQVHDKNRRYKNGKGTYEDVVRHLEEIKSDTSLAKKTREFILMTVLTADNLDIVSILKHHKKLNASSVQIKLVRSNDELSLNKGNIHLFKEAYQKLSDFLFCEYQNNQLEYFYMLVNSTDYFGKFIKNLMLTLPNHYRCGAGRDRLSFSADGNIYPCDNFVGKEEFLLGNLETGYDWKQAERFYGLSVTTMEKCKECWIRYLCAGDCCYNSYIHTKDIATPDEVMCEFFEFLANLAITLVADMGEVNKERYQKVKKIMFIRENNNFIH